MDLNVFEKQLNDYVGYLSDCYILSGDEKYLKRLNGVRNVILEFRETKAEMH